MSDFKFTEEILASGELLDNMVDIFKKDNTKDNMYKAMALLRSSKVWIPCKISMSDRDQARFNSIIEKSVENMGAPLIGSFENKDGIKTIPELLKNGDDCFMPIFSSEKHMTKYDQGFIKVNKPILEVIEIAKNNKADIKGLVLNPFSNSLLIPKSLWEGLEKMDSLIKD